MVVSTLVVALDSGVVPAHITVVCTILTQVNLGGEQFVQSVLIVAGPYGLPVVATIGRQLQLDVIFGSIVALILIIIGENYFAAIGQVQTGRAQCGHAEVATGIGALVALDSCARAAPSVALPSCRGEVLVETFEGVAIGNGDLAG